MNDGLERQRQQEITEYLDDDTRVAVQEQITGTMVLCVDATKMPTLGEHEVV